jgi:hypothetical protein
MATSKVVRVPDRNAAEPRKNMDMAILWGDGARSLARIRKLKGITFKGIPKCLRCPGGRVAVIQNYQDIRATFVAERIDGPLPVILAGGERRNGHIIRAKAGSLRFHRPGERSYPYATWTVPGEIRYLKPPLGDIVYVTDQRRSERAGLPGPIAPAEPSGPLKSFAYGMSNPNLPKGSPERKLVGDYVDWINDHEKFGFDFLEEPGFHTDLFDRSRWRLVEAKTHHTREYLRTAVGQLLDYKRFYRRVPSIGVLTYGKPSDPCLSYLSKYKVVAIWKTRGGFSDSADGEWTTRRRVT